MLEYTDEQIRRRAEEEYAMYSSQGWQALAETLEEQIEIHDTLDNVCDEKDLWYRRGIVEALKMVLARPAMIKQLLQQVEEIEDASL